MDFWKSYWPESIFLLTHFMPLISFCTLWKQQKASRFLMFSRGIERDQWHEMGWKLSEILENYLRYYFGFSRILLSRCLSIKEKAFLQIQPFEYACTFIKKRLQHRCFPVNIEQFLRTAFFIEHLWWLLLIFSTNFWIWTLTSTVLLWDRRTFSLSQQVTHSRSTYPWL